MKLTVIILTYNHEKYIRQALESVCLQVVDFKFKVIVADDCSNDRTKDEIKSFKSNNIIQIDDIYATKNNGILQNALNIFNKIEGEYVALLDGDDYWNFPNKLQLQVDFLDSNNEYSGCFHDTAIISDKLSSEILFANAQKYSEVYHYKKSIYPADVIKRLILPTSSLVLRTSFLKKIDLTLFKDDYSLDWKLICLAISNSKFFYFDQIMSVYRNHINGISKSENIQFHKSHIDFLKLLTKRAEFYDCLLDIYTALSKEYILVLERTSNKDFRLKKIFFLYVLAEFKKVYYFYKLIFKYPFNK